VSSCFVDVCDHAYRRVSKPDISNISNIPVVPAAVRVSKDALVSKDAVNRAAVVSSAMIHADQQKARYIKEQAARAIYNAKHHQQHVISSPSDISSIQSSVADSIAARRKHSGVSAAAAANMKLASPQQKQRQPQQQQQHIKREAKQQHSRVPVSPAVHKRQAVAPSAKVSAQPAAVRRSSSASNVSSTASSYKQQQQKQKLLIRERPSGVVAANIQQQEQLREVVRVGICKPTAAAESKSNDAVAGVAILNKRRQDAKSDAAVVGVVNSIDSKQSYDAVAANKVSNGIYSRNMLCCCNGSCEQAIPFETCIDSFRLCMYGTFVRSVHVILVEMLLKSE
jgi:hypothetical protein